MYFDIIKDILLFNDRGRLCQMESFSKVAALGKAVRSESIYQRLDGRNDNEFGFICTEIGQRTDYVAGFRVLTTMETS